MVLFVSCDSNLKNDYWFYNKSAYDIEFKILSIKDEPSYTLKSGESFSLVLYESQRTNIISDFPVYNNDTFFATYFYDIPQKNVTFVNITDKSVQCSTSDKWNPIIDVDAKETKTESLFYADDFEFKSLTSGVGLYYDKKAVKILLF